MGEYQDKHDRKQRIREDYFTEKWRRIGVPWWLLVLTAIAVIVWNLFFRK